MRRWIKIGIVSRTSWWFFRAFWRGRRQKEAIPSPYIMRGASVVDVVHRSRRIWSIPCSIAQLGIAHD
jgi:hypothetical protein